MVLSLLNSSMCINSRSLGALEKKHNEKIAQDINNASPVSHNTGDGGTGPGLLKIKPLPMGLQLKGGFTAAWGNSNVIRSSRNISMRGTPRDSSWTPGRSFDEPNHTVMVEEEIFAQENGDQPQMNPEYGKHIEKTEEDIERRLKISFDKQYHETHFISDLLSQKVHLADLLAYLMILEQAEGVNFILPQTQAKTKAAGSLAYENSVLSTMLRSVGYVLERSAKPTIPAAKGLGPTKNESKVELNLKITSAYSYYSTFLLKSVSMNTSSRPRITVCLFDCGSNKHLLLVKGEEEYIWPSLEHHLNKFPKERALYKQLMGIYRKRGLKRVLLAARYMKDSEAKTYIAAIAKASSTKRGDQQEELEKIARIYEKGMYFMGAVGLTDELREDAVPAIDLISRAKPNLFMLSGDSLDSCLTVAKKLNFCPGIDFEESQGYYKLSGTNEAKLLIQFRRILEDIGEMLSKHHIHEKQILSSVGQAKGSSQKELENSSSGIDPKTANLGLRYERFRSNTASQSQNPQLLQKLFALALNPYIFDTNQHLQIKLRTLLLSGQSFETIIESRNTDLAVYLQIVVLFCNRIIGHSMKAACKSRFVQMTQMSFPFTVAVGDGFNDIAMLNTSATGVQIETKSVPIIIAEGVAKSLSDFAKYLVLSAYANIRSGLYSANLAVWNFSLLGMIGSIRQALGYPRGQEDSQISNTLVSCLMIDLLLFYLLNPHPTIRILKHDPSITSEVAAIYRNSLRYFAQMMMLSILQGIIIAVYIEMYIGSLIDSRGRPVKQDTIDFASIIVIFLVCKLRAVLMHTKITTSVALFSLCSPAVFVLGVYRWYTTVQSSSAYFEKFVHADVLTSQFFICAVLLIVIAVFYLDLIWMMGFKYRLLFKHISRWTTPTMEECSRMAPAFSLTNTQAGTSVISIGSGSSSPWSRILLSGHRGHKPASARGGGLQKLPTSWTTSGQIQPGLSRSQFILDTENYQGRLTKLSSLLSKLDRNSTRSVQQISNAIGFQFTKRYEAGDFNSKWLKRLKLKPILIQSRKVLTIALVLLLLEYGLILVFYGTTNWMIPTGIPFLILTLVPLLLSTYLSTSPRIFYRFLPVNFLVWVGGLLFLMLTNSPNMVTGLWMTAARMPQTQLPLSAKLSGFLGFCLMVLSCISLLVNPGVLEVTNMFSIIGGFTALLISWMLTVKLKASQQAQADLGLLEQASLHRQIADSKEMLAMLIPWFILDKFDNLSLSVNYMADDVGEVSILFCDICNFDQIIKHCQDKIVRLLDDIFRQFDIICKQHGVQKVETVGKTYMACAGLKIVDKQKHKAGQSPKNASPVSRVVTVALEMKRYIQEFVHAGDYNLQIKIGIHHGTCIFGVLGYHKPQFSLIGDTINTTSRHCTTGQAGQVVLSEAAWKELQATQVEELPHQVQYVEMKGKGYVSTYIISGQDEWADPEPAARTGSKNLSGFSRRQRQTKTVGNLQQGKVD